MRSDYLRLNYIDKIITCNQAKLIELKEKGFHYSFKNGPAVFVKPEVFDVPNNSYFDEERKEELYEFHF